MAARWRNPNWGATRIAVVYLTVSTVWIFGSDWLVGLFVASPERITAFQLVKGTAFIGLSTLLLFALVRREQRKLATANADLEQTLAHAGVLHRILRHNLRNSCDVIGNNVDLLGSDRGDPAENRARIRRQVERLSDIAEKTQHLRTVVVDDELHPTGLDLTAVVAEAVADAREEYPDATITVDVPDAVPVVAHPRLGVALLELLANAVVHHDESDAAVHVSVERDGDDAVVRVADDGPGLPAVEQEVLGCGVEHTLAHSRGIGLWMVRFIVTESGGTTTAETAGDGGTTVTVRLSTAA